MWWTLPGHRKAQVRKFSEQVQGIPDEHRHRNEPWSQVTVVPLPRLPGVSYEGAA